jgi:SAM-dependent methyltransferase
MAQITSGLRSILSHPYIYLALQALMGGHASRKLFSKKYIKPFSGMNILDIGCGPAEILRCLPKVNYYGFDISEEYIKRAKNNFGASGKFTCKNLNNDDLKELPSFDVSLALGLIHHLNDDEVIELLKLAKSSLKPGGRLICLDPCWEKNQGMIAKLLISFDRGQNVRDKTGYEKLIAEVFEKYQIEIRHTEWIPYTHCIIECIN